MAGVVQGGLLTGVVRPPMATAPLQVKLSTEQRRDLAAALRAAPDVRTYKRMKLVQLSDRGYMVEHLASLFDLHEQAVRRALHAYTRGGLAALPDAPRSGRPPKLPAEYRGGEARRRARAAPRRIGGGAYQSPRKIAATGGNTPSFTSG